MDQYNIGDIGSIQFGILSAEEIIAMSATMVCKNSLKGKFSVYAEEMGCITGINEECKTCNLSKECWGHFGYIKLNEPILHPLCYKMVTFFLKCFCKKCYKLLILKEQVELNDLSKIHGKKRFTKILEKMEKTDVCPHCNSPQPKITYKTKESIISMEYKQKKSAGQPKLTIIFTVEDIKTIFDNISNEDVETLGLDPKEIHPKNLILTVLPVIPQCSRPYVMADGNTCDDDLTYQLVEIIKLNNQLSDSEDNKKKPSEQNRPHVINSLNFRIKTMFNNSKGKAKHPTDSRPIKSLKERLTGKEGRMRSSIMGKRVDFSGRTVIGAEPTLGVGYLGVPREIIVTHTFPEYVNELNIDYLQDLVDNDHANFIIKKDKKIRINLKYALHKKGTTVQFGDIVVRGDVKLENDDEDNVIIPKNFGYTIEKTAEYFLNLGDIVNKKRVITEAKKYKLNKGDFVKQNIEVFYISNQSFILEKDDILVRENKIIPVEMPSKRVIKLEIGDIVERHLRENDIVLLNRQPTLWKGSMMTHKIVPSTTGAKTFRFNLMSCSSFNADFDGDEMNIHAPQSYNSKINLRLADVSNNMISAQNSQPNIVIVQDALLASFLMTKNKFKLTRQQFKRIFTGIVDHEGKPILTKEKVENIRKVLKKYNKPEEILNGKGIFSLLFPDNLFYENQNNANTEEPTVKICSGVLIEGALTKDVLGKSGQSLLIILNKEYGVDVLINFINNVYFVANRWLIIHGFSIGLEDCMVSSEESVVAIRDVLTKCYAKARSIEENTQNSVVKEVRVTAELNKAKDVGMKLAYEAMKPTNNFLATVTSKAKGDLFNITQITGIGGQQNISNERIAPALNHKKRTLPHYPFENLDKEKEYESRGFIKSSFIRGFSPEEFYFHAMSGREGVCDTAMGTAKTGYMQRRIVKAAEDIQIQYDGTVRDAQKKVYQFSFGNNGFDPQKTVKVDGDICPTNISRLVNKLNFDYEEKQHDGQTDQELCMKKCLILEIKLHDYTIQLSEEMSIKKLETILEQCKKKDKKVNTAEKEDIQDVEEFEEDDIDEDEEEEDEEEDEKDPNSQEDDEEYEEEVEDDGNEDDECSD